MTIVRFGALDLQTRTANAYLCIPMHIYAYLCIFMHTYAYLAYLCISMHIYAYLCISLHIYEYLCISVHIYGYSCIFMHIYAYLCIELLGTTQTVLIASPGGAKMNYTWTHQGGCGGSGG